MIENKFLCSFFLLRFFGKTVFLLHKKGVKRFSSSSFLYFIQLLNDFFPNFSSSPTNFKQFFSFQEIWQNLYAIIYIFLTVWFIEIFLTRVVAFFIFIQSGNHYVELFCRLKSCWNLNFHNNEAFEHFAG